MTGRTLIARILLAACVAGVAVRAGGPVRGEVTDPPEHATAAGSVAVRLDGIRRELVALEFERALGSIEELLRDLELSKAERAEGLVLRAQAHVASGNLGAAERDYAEILALRPGFVPDARLTPAKAMARFDRVRRDTVGAIVLMLDPPDAEVRVDGEKVTVGPDGEVLTLAGERTIVVSADGFDPHEQTIQVAADKTLSVEARLVPNARTVILRTEPEGALVRVDGTFVGETRRFPGDAGPGAVREKAQLTIPHLPLGSHVFEIEKPCYRSRRFEDLLTVDLMERSPKVFETVVLEPSRTRLVLRGGPEGAETIVDGGVAGLLPLDPLLLCPGRQPVEIRAGGRIVWWRELDLPAEDEVVVEILPRPNVAVLGADGWPAALRSFGASFSTRAGIPLPRGKELSDPAGWEEVRLPADTDLALAVTPAAAEGLPEVWLLYSPILGTVDRLDERSIETSRPRWSSTAIGVRLADSEMGGRARVVEVLPGSAAEAAGIVPGDRIGSVEGVPVDGSAAAMEAIEARPVGSVFRLGVEGLSGATREVRCSASRSPRLVRAPPNAIHDALTAAWAAVDAAASSDESATARASLAMLLSDRGRHDLAAALWRQVNWGKRAGVGEGTRAYHLARELEALGEEREALELYRAAESSASSAYRDDGAAIAPAARDHLADLGADPAQPGRR